jgi:predicted small lipoprotein YifL
MVPAIREPALTSRRFLGLAVTGALALSFALSACGRKGSLELPPRASAQPAGQQEAQPSQPSPQWGLFGDAATAAQPDGLPPDPKGQKKSFLLDWLLN